MISQSRRCDREAFQSPLGIRFQAIQPSPYRAGLAEPNLQRLPVASASTACFCPVGLSPAGKPLTQGSVAPNTLLSAKGINYAPDTAHQNVESVSNLDGPWRSSTGALRIGPGPIAADDLDPSLCSHPLGER